MGKILFLGGTAKWLAVHLTSPRVRLQASAQAGAGKPIAGTGTLAVGDLFDDPYRFRIVERYCGGRPLAEAR
jgi:hypothetical protein